MTDTLDRTATANLDRIEDLVRRLERLGINPAGLFPEQRAALDAYNNPGYVAAGELIESAWGNAASSHVARTYPTNLARNTENPTPFVGQVTYVAGNNSLQLRDATNIWIEPGGHTYQFMGTHTGVAAPVSITGSGWTTRSALRRYKVSVQIPIFKGGAAGQVQVSINPAVGGQAPILHDFGTPESGTIKGSWLVGGLGGGSIAIQSVVGTVDITGGGWVLVEDIGALSESY